MLMVDAADASDDDGRFVVAVVVVVDCRNPPEHGSMRAIDLQHENVSTHHIYTFPFKSHFQILHFFSFSFFTWH